MRRFTILLLLFAVTCAKRSEIPAPEPEKPVVVTAAPSHQEEIGAWQKRRYEGLQKPDSWLTLVGLAWLKEGKNLIKLPTKPPTEITVDLAKGVATLHSQSGLTVDGKELQQPVILRDDTAPDGPLKVTKGTLTFHAIRRSEKYAIRMRDSESDARKNFKGLEYFPIDPQWKIEARFEPFNPPRKIPITNVLGMTSEETAPGTLVFERDGKTIRLQPILEQGETDLFVIFKDETSGKETYPAARYLYAKPAGPDGKVILDFNKAYNPPCAFTPFATCPLPPAQNRLPFRVEAGEKNYHL